MDWSELANAALGGLMIGAAASAVLLLLGRVLGVSGIVSGLLTPQAGDSRWRIAFVMGLVVGGALMLWREPALFENQLIRSLPAMALGGLLVGFGTRLGSGCTSGHGVCGVARLGPRSILATLTFMATGALVTLGVNRLLGGSV